MKIFLRRRFFRKKKEEKNVKLGVEAEEKRKARRSSRRAKRAAKRKARKGKGPFGKISNRLGLSTGARKARKAHRGRKRTIRTTHKSAKRSIRSTGGYKRGSIRRVIRSSGQPPGGLRNRNSAARRLFGRGGGKKRISPIVKHGLKKSSLRNLIVRI